MFPEDHRTPNVGEPLPRQPVELVYKRGWTINLMGRKPVQKKLAETPAEKSAEKPPEKGE